MDSKSNDNLHKEITEKIISAFFKVYNTLGFGFLEKVYEKALKIELESISLKTKNQFPINVYYKGNNVGDYFADLIVDDKVIVELKAVDILCKEHECQLLNYLKATEYEVGLLLNFGKQPEIKRKIFTNNLKNLKHTEKNRLLSV
jgi:GxxExxY protein